MSDVVQTPRQGAVLAARLRAVEADRDAWRKRAEAAQRETDRLAKKLKTVEGSESYKLGRAMVSLVRSPVKSSPKLLRQAFRRLRPAPRALPAPAAAPAAKPARRLPTHVYVALGFDDAGLRALVQAVAQCARITLDHTPVVVTDNASFSLLRNLGVIFEYVPDRATWQQHRTDDWEPVLAERLAVVFRAHQSQRTVLADPADPPGLARLLGLHEND
jgi:hypothetical protein